MSRPHVPVVFSFVESGMEDQLEVERNLVDALAGRVRKFLPEAEITTHVIHSLEDATKTLEEAKDAASYIVFVFSMITGFFRTILWSGKPCVVIAQSLTGSGDLLMEYSRARGAGMPLVAVALQDIFDEEVLGRYIGYLRVIYKLKSSRVLFIMAPATMRQMALEFPLSVDMYSTTRYIQSLLGVTPLMLNVRKFTAKYYDVVDEKEAEEIANKWIREAKKVVEQDKTSIIKSARLYLALKRCAEDYEADAVAIDCLVLFYSDYLDAWPCLAFMELAKEGKVIPVCEADAHSAAILLMMKYVANRPGYINDPAVDTLNGEVVYFHCFSPINPYGYGSGKTVPYIITPAHGGTKKVSVHVELPESETATLVGLSPEERVLAISKSKILGNIFATDGLHGLVCASKVVAKTNTGALLNNWVWRAGWHRVLFYGDWREELKDLATLLRLKVVEEDKE